MCLATDECLTAGSRVTISIPARSHAFTEIDHKNISKVILLPSTESFKKDVVLDCNKSRTNALLSKILIWNILQFVSRNQRILCKFRISHHKLEIEQGRYKNISADKRTCKLCNNGVEDEIHSLLKCSVLENMRKIYFQ